jgi:hypothetical protein
MLEVTRGDNVTHAELGADDQIIIQFQPTDESNVRQLLRRAYDIVMNSDSQDAHPDWIARTRIELGLVEAKELIGGSIHAQVGKILESMGMTPQVDDWIAIDTSGDTFYFFTTNNRWMIRQTDPKTGTERGEAIPLFATDFTKFVPVAKDVANAIVEHLMVGQYQVAAHIYNQQQ